VLDLGVWFDNKSSFSEHMPTKINKAYMLFGIIKQNFKHLTVPTFVLLYTSMARSHTTSPSPLSDLTTARR